MFTLALVDDTIKVAASQLNVNNIVAALTYNINQKYANRIVPNVGLCIAHFDYVSISEGKIRHGDGGTYYKTTFRLIIFRPFMGEVLVGRVKSFDKGGIRITMGFFDDIYVSWDALPQPSAYDEVEASWFWAGWSQDDAQQPPDADEAGAVAKGDKRVKSTLDSMQDEAFRTNKEERFYFFKDEPVRFVIESDEFNEPEPPGPDTYKTPATTATSAVSQGANGQVGGEAISEYDSGKRIAPYRIKASMMISGTGMLSWWLDSEAEAQMAEEA